MYEPKRENVQQYIRELSKYPEEKQRLMWRLHFEHFNELPEILKPVVRWQYCKLYPKRSTSGFHGLEDSKYDPISFCGWADYGDMFQGVAFRINRDCFIDDNDPELYYVDDDMTGDLSERQLKWLNKMLDTMNACSSGIRDIHLHQEHADKFIMFRGRMEDFTNLISIRFTLDASMIRDSVSLSGQEIPASETGGYVLVVPRAGEFFCELGEIRYSERVPLLIDDYCMK